MSVWKRGWVAASVALLCLSSVDARAYCGLSEDGHIAPTQPDVVLGALANTTLVNLRLRGDARRWIVPVGGPVDRVIRVDEGMFDAALRVGAPVAQEQWQRDPCSHRRRYIEDDPFAMGEPIVAPNAEPNAEPGASDSSGWTRREPPAIEPIRFQRIRRAQVAAWIRRQSFAPALKEALVAHAASGGELVVLDGDVGPVQLRVREPAPTVPLPIANLCKLPDANDLLVRVLAVSERYAPRGRPSNFIPTNLLVDPAARPELAAVHGSVVARMRALREGTIVTEYAGRTRCIACDQSRSLYGRELALLAGALPDSARPWSSTVEMEGPLTHRGARDLERCHARAAALRPASARGSISAKLEDNRVRIVDTTFLSPMTECVRQTLDRQRSYIHREWVEETIQLDFRATPNGREDPFGLGPEVYHHTLTRLRVPLDDADPARLTLQPARPVAGGDDLRGRDPVTWSRRSLENDFRTRYLVRHPWPRPPTCPYPRGPVWDDVAPESGPVLPGAPRTPAVPEAISDGPMSTLTVTDDPPLLVRTLARSEPRLEVVVPPRPPPPAPTPAPAAAPAASRTCAASQGKPHVALIAFAFWAVRRRFRT